MDGSQKLPQRLLGTLRDQLKAGGSFTRLALGVAGWMSYITGTDETGAPIEVKDPMASRLALLGHRYRSAWGWVTGDLTGAQKRLVAWREAVARPSGAAAEPLI